MRLIDADALKEVLGDTRDGEPIFRETEFVRMDIIEEAIDEAPTLPNPCGKPCAFIRPHGEWTVRHDTMYHFECPFCKYLHQYKDNFCPLCGASMTKEGEVECFEK